MPFYMRFFGIGKNQVVNTLTSVLDSEDVYFVKIDYYEVVVELFNCNESFNQVRSLIIRHLSDFFIGYGKHNSIEKIVGQKLIRRHLSITGAESLTAGMFQSILGNVPGISAVFPGGFVTYSNRAKHQLLGIPSNVINKYGVVSSQVARWMASQSRKIMHTDFSVSFTGVAGPSSLEGQPAGTVWMGLSMKDGDTKAHLYHLIPLYHELNGFKSPSDLKSESRDAIRLLSVKTGLKMVNNEFRNRE